MAWATGTSKKKLTAGFTCWILTHLLIIKLLSVWTYNYGASDFKTTWDMQKHFRSIHRTELLPLFKKENKPQECVILLATVSEVKGGRWEGTGQGKGGNGSARGAAAWLLLSQQSSVQPQAVTSACSCAQTFALFTAGCAVCRTAGLQLSLTQAALVGLNWPGRLKKYLA